MSKKYLDTVGLNKLVANILSKFAAKNHSHSNATTNSAGFMSSSDKVKLDGVSTGANRTIVDSTLSSTSVNAIQNKAVKTALDGKAASSHTHPTAQITGLDAALAGKAPSSHSHSADNITSGVLPIGRGGTGASSSKGAQYNIMNDILEGTVNASDSDVFILKHHTPSATDGALLTRSAAQVWAWIKSKCDGLYQPRGSYASSSHTHTIANVSNLQSTLDSKASVSHTHSNATATASGFMSNTDKSKLDGVSTGANKTIVDASFSATSTNPVQNKVVKAALDAKASSSHTHTTSQVSGLDAALSGKAPTSHTHTIAQVTNLQSQLYSKVPVGRLINKKPLSTDITLTPADIGADAAGAATNALNSAKQYTDTVAAGKAAKSHVHDATNITTGTLSQDRLPLVPVSKGGTGKTNGKDAANYFINSLEEGTLTPTDADKILTQYAGGGTTNTTYVRRPISTLWSYIKPKCDAIYQPKGNYAASSHNHSASNITSGTLPIERGGTGATTAAGMRSNIGVNAVKTSGTGAAYTATVNGITSLSAGVYFTMIPHTVSTVVNPTLNVNGLGAKMLRRRLSNSNVNTVVATDASWIGANSPVRVVYDGQFWIIDSDKPKASDIYGSIVGSQIANDAISLSKLASDVGTVAVQATQPTDPNVKIWVKTIS